MNQPPARVLHGMLDLLDRQLRDRNGRLCGNVDDLEIERTDDGQIYVTHLICGGGALAYRLGLEGLGRWLHRATNRLHDVARDRTMIPIVLARRFGPAIDLEIDVGEIATSDGEQWVRTHIIDHIPLGGRHARQ